MERAMPKPWSLYRLYQGGFIFPSQTFHWTSPPHTHTQTQTLSSVAGYLWQPKGNKNNNVSRPCQSQSIWMPLDGGWVSMHKLVVSKLCIRKFHHLKSSSTDLENNLPVDLQTGSLKTANKKKQGVTFHLNEKKQRFLLSGYHVSLENFHSSIQMDRSLFGSGHTQIPAKLNHVNPMVTP